MKKITIAWLYPELMSTYGDRGNIICLKKRCQWRNIDCEIKELNVGFDAEELKKADFIFMGGAQDRQQKIVSQDLTKKSKILKDMIESDVPGLYICGALQFLGKYYKESDGSIIECLDIIDLYTENPGIGTERLIGNVAIESEINGKIESLIGFENHGGRTFIGKQIMPLGRVIVGNGNNGIDKTEGAIYKKSYCSYLHGPILPKNPFFADLLIEQTLKKKYKNGFFLKPLNEEIELMARKSIADRLGIKV